MSVKPLTDDEIKDVFIYLDENESGTLDMTELGNALSLLNIDLTAKEITEKYNVDDNPEPLTLQEFTNFIRERIETMGIDVKERLKGAFHEFDDTGDGKIPRGKLLEILTALGSDPLSQEEAEDLLDLCKTEDGKYDAEEMVEVLTEAMNS